MFADWGILAAGLIIFLVFPLTLVGYALWAAKRYEKVNDLDQIGSMDVDERLKRFKDQ